MGTLSTTPTRLAPVCALPTFLHAPLMVIDFICSASGAGPIAVGFHLPQDLVSNTYPHAARQNSPVNHCPSPACILSLPLDKIELTRL